VRVVGSEYNAINDHPRIIFVPGLKPKPPVEPYRAQLARVLIAALEGARPESARWLAEHPESFTVVQWTYVLYREYRDIGLDLPGIERLLAHAAPSLEDRRELDSWSRAAVRLAHVLGDAWPALGRWIVRPATRLQMHEANSYLRDRGGVGTAIRKLVRDEIDKAFAAGDRLLLMGHSLGSVICYDTLWDLSHAATAAGSVDLFVTMGSPLATHFILRRLRGAGKQGADAYPRNIRRWVNFAARGDTTALQPRLKPHFHEMIDRGLVASIEDYVDLANYFRGSIGLNAHEAYGYLAQRALAEVVGDWLERG
jgi:hypothetical protein